MQKAWGLTSVKVATDDVERDKIWAARRSALSALAKLKPTLVLEDATVPRSRIPDMVKALQEIAEKYRIEIGTFGHAGDGNLHPTILTDKRNKEEWHRVESAIEEIFDKGPCHGRHPFPENMEQELAKGPFLEKETGMSSIPFFQGGLEKPWIPTAYSTPAKLQE